jgi:DNA invertase Pin-like site-specific DNA recombinase
MENRNYAYGRVSDKSQHEDRQMDAFINAGVDERFIFIDRQSGKDFDRPQYKMLTQVLRRGDTLVIKSIDRLGRNYTDIQGEWRRITKEIGANMKVLDMPLLDTTVLKNDLTDTFIADIVLQILSYVAEQERNNIKQRQAEGIAAAQAKGKHLGRPKANYPGNWDAVYADWKADKIKAVDAMKILNLKKNTFYNLVKQSES